MQNKECQFGYMCRGCHAKRILEEKEKNNYRGGYAWSIVRSILGIIMIIYSVFAIHHSKVLRDKEAEACALETVVCSFEINTNNYNNGDIVPYQYE